MQQDMMPTRDTSNLGACKLHGCKPVTNSITNAGFRMILDARTSFEIREGYQITCIFVTEELIRDWPKIIVPDSQELTRLANSMQSPKIKINFEVKSSIGNKNV